MVTRALTRQYESERARIALALWIVDNSLSITALNI